MGHNHENQNHDHEGSFHKGLFWGLIAGVGLIWFLNSEEGKKMVDKLKNKLDETLSSITTPEDEEDPLEIGISNKPPDHSNYITSEEDL